MFVSRRDEGGVMEWWSIGKKQGGREQGRKKVRSER
jgi:hypothetical protein